VDGDAIVGSVPRFDREYLTCTAIGS
jgi:hypothetical protein